MKKIFSVILVAAMVLTPLLTVIPSSEVRAYPEGFDNATVPPSNSDFPDVLSRTLHVEGNKIFNDLGQEVILRGVNISRLEWSQGSAYLLDLVRTAIDPDIWNSNIIRLPLNQDYWLASTPAGATYRATVAEIVRIVSEVGRYVEFDLHWSGTGVPGTARGQQRMPDMRSIDFWISVAETYKNHPAVLFNLYNEPNPVHNLGQGIDGWVIWRDGGMITTSNTGASIIPFETPGHQRLVNEIRAVGANNIIVASGIGMASTLTGIARNDAQGRPIALRDTPMGNGIMYAGHLYPGDDIWFQGGRLNSDDRRPDGNNVFLCISDIHPIIIGEWGQHLNHNMWNTGRGYNCGYHNHIPGQWVQGYPEYVDKFLTWAERHRLHWTAWAFHANVGPPMLTANALPFPPNAHFGQKVQDALLAHPRNPTLLPEVAPGISFFMYNKAVAGAVHAINSGPDGHSAADWAAFESAIALADLTLTPYTPDITFVMVRDALRQINTAMGFLKVTFTYTISASPSNIEFGSVQIPYTQPLAQTVMITNTGNSQITRLAASITSGRAANWTVGALSETSLNPGQTATFTVRPNAGLGVGTHNIVITITGSGGAIATVSADFSVARDMDIPIENALDFMIDLGATHYYTFADVGEFNNRDFEGAFHFTTGPPSPTFVGVDGIPTGALAFRNLITGKYDALMRVGPTGLADAATAAVMTGFGASFGTRSDIPYLDLDNGTARASAQAVRTDDYFVQVMSDIYTPGQSGITVSMWAYMYADTLNDVANRYSGLWFLGTTAARHIGVTWNVMGNAHYAAGALSGVTRRDGQMMGGAIHTPWAPGGVNTPLAVREWTHIVFSVAADGTPRLYVNGVAAPPHPLTTTAPLVELIRSPGAADPLTWARFFIGLRASQTGRHELPNTGFLAEAFSGKIADFAIFNRVLTDAEVDEVYNVTLNGVGRPGCYCDICGADCTCEAVLSDAEFLQSLAADILANGLTAEQLILSGNNNATLTLFLDGREFILAENVNNRNVSGKFELPDGSGTLVFDIRGNGSNIRVFEVILK